MLNRLTRTMRKATRLVRSSQKSAAKAAALRIAAAVPKTVSKNRAKPKAKPPKAKLAQPKLQVTPPGGKPRAALGETVRRISAGGMPAHQPLSQTRPSVRRGASFTKAQVTINGATRSYKLYIPAAAKTAGPDVLLPLIIMLHGCSQTPDDFALGTNMNRTADRFGVLVAYPAQPRSAHSRKCWNWYRAGQAEHADEAAEIAEIARAVLRSHPADPRRVYIAGLSAGGAAAVAAAQAHPEIFAAAGVHSGLPVGAAHDPASALMAMAFGSVGKRQVVPMPTIVFHGDADRVVHPGNGRAVAARSLASFKPLMAVVKTGSAGGRAFTRARHGAMRGKSYVEHWSISGAGHAWSGGAPAGSFADAEGPDASAEMLRFFLQHRNAAKPDVR